MRKPVLVPLAFAAAALLPAAPLHANLVVDWPPKIEFGLFAAGLQPRTAGLEFQPGFHVGLGSAAGAGAEITAFWNGTLSTTLTASAFRPGIRLSGSAAASGDGGRVELEPISAMVQVRASRFHRAVPYVEAGITYLLLSSSTRPALAAAGISNLRRPDHIALITGAGLRLGLKGPWTANLDVTYRPLAQSIFPVTTAGQVMKEQTIDIHAMTFAGGIAYRF